MSFRRYQYSNTPKVAFWMMVLVSFGLFILSPYIRESVQYTADSLFSPSSRAGAVISQSFLRVIRSAKNMVRYDENIEELTNRVAQLRAQLVYQQHLSQKQAQQINDLNQLKDRIKASAPKAHLLSSSSIIEAVGISAWKIASDSSSYRNYVLVDRGEKDGIMANAPVTIGGALIGQVAAVRKSTSRVRLLYDPSFQVGVRFLNSVSEESKSDTRMVADPSVQGLLHGVQHGLCKVKYVSRDAPVEAGDTVITSGLDGIFPAGLFIGKVVRTKKREIFLEIDVHPYARINSLSTLLILSPLNDKTRSLNELRSKEP